MRVKQSWLIQQLGTNGDLSTAASNKIVNNLNKIVNGVLTQILKAVKNKPLAIALIATLSKYPKVVDAIKSGVITGLNSSELNIFDWLNVLDNNTFKALVDYYSTVDQNDDVFRTNSRAESQLSDEEETKLDDSAVSDSGINPPSEISKTDSDIIDANEIAAIDVEATKIYDIFTNENNKDKLTNIKHILNSFHTIVYKNRLDETKILNMQGEQLLINYIVKYNRKFKKSAYPWLLIKESMPEIFDELAIAKKMQNHHI